MFIDKETYRVGIYTRLSIDDGNNEESVSIDTQKKILTEFVTKKGWQIAKVYADDGFSGGNFERPDFKRMIQDIENKEIDCVVTKDLSRLGRNYLDCGYYLEIYFPQHQVRYIAVNDGVDTISNTSMDITPFKNILNEMYVKDISVKVSSARKARAKDGKYMATTAPYGYLKDPQNHNHLMIDEETAPIIREIFEMYAQGKGTLYITKYLENKKVLRPTEYWLQKGLVKKVQRRNKGCYYWSNKTILDILSNPVYIGAVVGNKTKKVSPKIKKIVKVPKEQWTIIEDMHEPIVSKELFEKVQRIREKNRILYKNTIEGERFKNIFSKMIRCPNDRNMNCKKIYARGDSVSIENRKYYCDTTCPHRTKECKNICIRAEKLYKIVFDDINKYADVFCNNKENYSILEQKLEEMTSQNTRTYENEKKKLENRLNELSMIITSSYEDKVFKRITEDTFAMISNKYENEKIEIKEKLKKVIEEIEDVNKNNNNAMSFTKMLTEFKETGTSELTQNIVTNIIDKIIVYPSEIHINDKEEKEKIQKIKINYRYIGCIEPTTIIFENTIYKTRYTDRKCQICGKTFKPITSTEKYCNNCKDKGKIMRRREYHKEKIEAEGGNKGYRERTCILCGKTYKPNSSGQKYCSDCKLQGKRNYQSEWYQRKKENEKQKRSA